MMNVGSVKAICKTVIAKIRYKLAREGDAKKTTELQDMQQELQPDNQAEVQKGEQQEEQQEEQKLEIPESAYRNLTELFGKNDKLIYRGRKPFFDIMYSIFAKLHRKNLVILGETGTGREGLVYGLAERIKRGECPEMFKEYDVIEVNLREMFKEATSQEDGFVILDLLYEKLKSSKKAIIYVKPFTKVFEMSLLEVMRTWMDELGHIIIGTLDESDFTTYYTPNYNHPVLERFDIIRTEPISLDEAYDILRTKIEQYEEQYGIRISEENFEKLLMTAYQEAGGRVNMDMVLDYVDSAMANAKLHGILEVDYRSIMEIQKITLVQMQDDFTEEELNETSMHEASHAVVAAAIDEAPRFVTIIPGSKELGYNYFDFSKYVYTRQDIANKITMLLASCVLSKVTDVPFTNGSAGDLKQASNYAYNMILCWGMSEVEGENDIKSLISYLKDGDFNTDFLSDSAKEDVKEKVTKILEECAKRAEKCLIDHRDSFNEIAKALMRCCSLSRTDLLRLYHGEIVAEDLQDIKWREIE